MVRNERHLALTPEVESLLSKTLNPLPLTRHNMRPAARLNIVDALALFPNAEHPSAALAGLALQLGDWERAHEIAQNIEDREGSYWHAIVHRLEPEYWNSAYWFRRTGKHPIFEDLTAEAREILSAAPQTGFQMKNDFWNPEEALEWFRIAMESENPERTNALIRLQDAEIKLLWAYCIQAAPSLTEQKTLST